MSLEIPFFTISLRQFNIRSSTSFCFSDSTPSNPAANTNSLWSVSNPVNGESDFPKSVFSRAFLKGEAELSNSMLDIKYDSSNSTGS